MIRVYFYTDPLDRTKLAPALQRFAQDEPVHFPVQIVTNIDHADVVATTVYTSELMVHIAKHPRTSVVICQRYDSACIGSDVHANLPEVIAIFKDYLFRDAENTMREYKVREKRHHYALVDKSKQDVTTARPSGLDKFKVVPWGFVQYSHSLSKPDMLQASVEPPPKKDIDIFAVFHMERSGALGAHRRQVVDTVKKLGPELVVVTDPIANKKEYVETLRRSKVVVAPFGFGERIAADNFAIWANCVLVKPDCRYVDTVPDLYRDEYCEFFKVDGSDLGSVVSRAVRDYDRLVVEKTKPARDMFEAWTDRRLLDAFWETLVESYNSDTKECE